MRNRLQHGLVMQSLALAVFLLSALGANSLEAQPSSRPTRTHIVSVKYRETPVNLSAFEFLDTSKSSFVTGAWYDRQNSYMVIGLRGTYYHYCRMPPAAWTSLKAADSHG